MRLIYEAAKHRGFVFAGTLAANRFAKCTKGATAVEYGLICALMVVVIIAGITNFGTATEEVYNTVTDNIVQ